MASERVAFYMIHPRRSKEAFAALIENWAGLLVSDGYGVYQSWVEARQVDDHDEWRRPRPGDRGPLRGQHPQNRPLPRTERAVAASTPALCPGL
jgi:hypothetical protein